MIDHVTLKVRDLAQAKEFYTAVLAPLGYTLRSEFPGVIGFEAGGHADFWVGEAPDATSDHVAFGTQDHEAVDAFHAAALSSGGSDNGEPGMRPEYAEHYYAAYIHDPEGNNIEVVCHGHD